MCLMVVLLAGETWRTQNRTSQNQTVPLNIHIDIRWRVEDNPHSLEAIADQETEANIGPVQIDAPKPIVEY